MLTQVSCDGRLALVHNGIIENYQELKRELKKRHHFVSETDTEVLVHLIEDLYQGDLPSAVREALLRVRGTYGIAVISAKEPSRIIAARMGSPLILGVGSGENFIASDVSAFLGYTNQVVYLNDGEIVDMRREGFDLYDLSNRKVAHELSLVEWTQEESEKGGYVHFMLKEIMEQPEVIINSTRGRMRLEEGLVVLGGLKDVEDRLKKLIGL